VDFAQDEKGQLIRGKDGKFVAVPATKVVYSDPCLLALASARVPGFNKKVDHRLVGQNNEDRKIQLEVVYADKSVPE
jgi:hypothetical protein